MRGRLEARLARLETTTHQWQLQAYPEWADVIDARWNLEYTAQCNGLRPVFHTIDALTPTEVMHLMDEWVALIRPETDSAGSYQSIQLRDEAFADETRLDAFFRLGRKAGSSWATHCADYVEGKMSQTEMDAFLRQEADLYNESPA